MTSFYPIMLKLRGKKVVVVGGGVVAERKIAGLLAAKAAITVVSPEVTEQIRQFADAGELLWRKKFFSKEDIKDAILIFAAANDKKVNQSVMEAADDRQLVMAADDPEGSDFHVPAQVKRGRLNIAVSTGGASPILAQRIRRKLEQEFDERYEDYLEFLFQARQRILHISGNPAIKRELLRRIAGPEFFESDNREEDLLKLLKLQIP